MIKKISLFTLFGLLSTNANALEYSVDKWDFSLDADGMVGLLEPRHDQPKFIGDWDVKTQAIYKLNSTQKIGAVYSIDADCVEDNEYIHDAFLMLQDKNIGRAELGLTYSSHAKWD